MAIQDDNTILNKGDLKAYHEAIAPMLGGTLLSRTNVSDHYSTDEKIVGSYLGKPLYQRTWKSSTVQVISNAGWGQQFSIPKAGMEQIVKCLGNGNSSIGGQAWQFMANLDSSATYVSFLASRDGDTCGSTEVTLQYTKTTDAAGSATATPGAYDISFPNTWPENTEVYFGNGLYGKRITGSVALVAGTRQDIIIASGISSSGKIVSQGGHVLTSQNWKCPIPWSYPNHGSTPGTNFEAAAYTQLGPSIEHLLYIYTDILAGNTSYDVWVTYTK